MAFLISFPKLQCKPTHTYRNANKTEFQQYSPIQEAYHRFHSLLLQRIFQRFSKALSSANEKQKRCKMRIAIFTAISEKLLYLHTDNVESILHGVEWPKNPQFLSSSLTLLPWSLKVKCSFKWEHTRFGKSTEGLFLCWPKQVPECNLFQLKQKPFLPQSVLRARLGQGAGALHLGSTPSNTSPQHTATINTLFLSSGSLASLTLQILLQIRNSGMKYIQIYTRNLGGIIYRQFVLLQAPKIHKTSCIHSLDMKRLKHGIFAWNSANNNT